MIFQINKILEHIIRNYCLCHKKIIIAVMTTFDLRQLSESPFQSVKLIKLFNSQLNHSQKALNVWFKAPFLNPDQFETCLNPHSTGPRSEPRLTSKACDT